MRSFPAGLYLEVDEEVVAFARKASSPQLLLGTGEPPRVRVASAGFGRRRNMESVALPPDCDSDELAPRQPASPVRLTTKCSVDSSALPSAATWSRSSHECAPGTASSPCRGRDA